MTRDQRCNSQYVRCENVYVYTNVYSKKQRNWVRKNLLKPRGKKRGRRATSSSGRKVCKIKKGDDGEEGGEGEGKRKTVRSRSSHWRRSRSMVGSVGVHPGLAPSGSILGRFWVHPRFTVGSESSVLIVGLQQVAISGPHPQGMWSL